MLNLNHLNGSCTHGDVGILGGRGEPPVYCGKKVSRAIFVTNKVLEILL